MTARRKADGALDLAGFPKEKVHDEGTLAIFGCVVGGGAVGCGAPGQDGATNGLMTTNGGKSTVESLARCALANNDYCDKNGQRF